MCRTLPPPVVYLWVYHCSSVSAKFFSYFPSIVHWDAYLWNTGMIGWRMALLWKTENSTEQLTKITNRFHEPFRSSKAQERLWSIYLQDSTENRKSSGKVQKKKARVCLCLLVPSVYHKANLANGDISLQQHRSHVLVYKTEEWTFENKLKASLTSSLKGWKENSFVTTK